MIELKVLCPCGAKFKFDVEPVNNLVPVPIACPTCGQDVTDLANADLHQKLPAVPAAAVAPATPAKIGLRLSAHTAPAPAPAAAPLPAAPIPARTHPALSPAAAAHLAPVGDRSIWFGVAGALVASFVGMMIWFLLIKWTGYEIGWIAWGVGGLAGIGARVAGTQPSGSLGLFTALCAAAAILGGQFLAARSTFDEVINGSIEESYKTRMSYAQEGVKLKTDAEIKAFLTRHHDDDDDEEGKPQPIDQKRIQKFKDQEQGELQEFVDGKPSKAEFGRGIRAIQNTPGFAFLLMKESFSFFTLLWLFLGMSTAFKIASAASGD